MSDELVQQTVPKFIMSLSEITVSGQSPTKYIGQKEMATFLLRLTKPSAGRILILFCFSFVIGEDETNIREKSLPHWYLQSTYEVFDVFLRDKLSSYEPTGLPTDSWIQSALNLGSCTDCDPNESRWNTHFKIVNGTAYSAGGIPRSFWNDHHRKRVKSVFTILSKLLELEPDLPDVEFVVNFHDYNKLPRRKSLSWGDENYTPPFYNEVEDDPKNKAPDREGDAGLFQEHLSQWPGHDWELHYRIYGNHFGNPPVEISQGSVSGSP
jgi:hypothetical protein